eukprot:scaffold15590_cov136-Isochrysis_galbana.AAC.5
MPCPRRGSRLRTLLYPLPLPSLASRVRPSALACATAFARFATRSGSGSCSEGRTSAEDAAAEGSLFCRARSARIGEQSGRERAVECTGGVRMAIGIRPDGVPTSATQCQRALACFAIGEDIDRLRHGHGQPRAASITSMKVQGRAVGCRQGALPVGMATRRIRGVAPPGIVGRRALALSALGAERLL